MSKMTLTKNELEHLMTEVTNKLSSTIPDELRKIFLYGSYARGDFSDFSDVDIMVLLDSKQPFGKEYRNIVDEVTRPLTDESCIMVSCHFQNYRHFYDAMDCTSFYKNIEREGIVFYDSES